MRDLEYMIRRGPFDVPHGSNSTDTSTSNQEKFQLLQSFTDGVHPPMNYSHDYIYMNAKHIMIITQKSTIQEQVPITQSFLSLLFCTGNIASSTIFLYNVLLEQD